MLAEAWQRQRRWWQCEALRWCTAQRQQHNCSSTEATAVAAARQRAVSGSLAAARRRLTARQRHRGGSSTEAAADSRAPSANVPTHAPLNATDAPTYASSSLVEEGGMTAPAALLSLAATALPAATSTAVADGLPPPTTMPTAMPTTLFVKLNLIYYYYLSIYLPQRRLC